MPLGLALLSAAFPPEKRGAAIGMFSAVTGIAVASGPLVGGAVVEGITGSGSSGSTSRSGWSPCRSCSRAWRRASGPTPTRPPRPGARHRRGARRRLGAGARQRRRLGEPRGRRVAGGRRAAGRRVRRLGAAGARADAADALFRSRAFSAGNAAIFFTFASLFGAVFFYAQLSRSGSATARSTRGCGCPVDRDVHHRRADRRRARRPHRRAAADGHRAALQAAGMAWLALIADPAWPTRGCWRRSSSPASASRWRSRPRRTRSSARSTADCGKAAGANSMMRELGGVFGIALMVAVFAAAGSYARRRVHRRIRPAIGVGAVLALGGARAGLPRSPSPRERAPCARRRHGPMRCRSWFATRSSPTGWRRTRSSSAPSTRSCGGPAAAPLRDVRLDDGVSFIHLASAGRATAGPGGGVRALPGEHRRRCDEPPVVSELQRDRVRPPVRAGSPSSTWSCTPATCRARHVLRGAARLAAEAATRRTRARPRPRPRRRHRRVRHLARRFGSPTSRSATSTRSPTRARELGASVLLGPARGRRAGAAS